MSILRRWWYRLLGRCPNCERRLCITTVAEMKVGPDRLLWAVCPNRDYVEFSEWMGGTLRVAHHDEAEELLRHYNIFIRPNVS